MGYNFSKTSNSLIATLDTEDGKYDEHIIECFQPNILLGQERIVLKESSLRVQDFLFESIGQINGETPTNLIDGFEMLESFIKSIFVEESVSTLKTYKSYIALINQSGTNAPVATVLEDTLGGTVVFSYNAVGSYTATLTGAFVLNKTWVSITSSAGADVTVTAGRSSDNTVNIKSFFSGTLTNSIMSPASFEIRVYN